MIAEDFMLVKEIFSIISDGVIEGYDYLRYEVEVGSGYIDTEFTIEKNGIKVNNPKIDINNAILYSLVKKLRESAKQRGECWTSFVMSHKQGEQVKTKFKYDKD